MDGAGKRVSDPAASETTLDEGSNAQSDCYFTSRSLIQKPQHNQHTGLGDAATDKLVCDRPAGFATMLGFLYAICAIEGADLQLLPASFRALEVHLGLTPSSLAFLALCQALAQWVCTPVWGSLADHGFSRKLLIAVGALSWGTITMMLALTSSYNLMVMLRIMNGMALGSLSPISQSLLVDVTHATERGKFFGWVQFAANVGNVLCAVGTSTVSHQLFFGDIEGWRVAFSVVAVASILLGLSIIAFMPEPARRSTYDTIPTISGELSKVTRYFRIPTFTVIVLQGMFGCIPWSALSFMIFYFQYVGVSDFGASALFGMTMVGGAFGGIVGGLVGDRLARWSPRHGRPLTAQISVAAGIPLIAVILAGVPRDPGYVKTYASLILLFGITASWCATGVNRPILSEIVEERDRASVFAWLVTIDGTFAALFGAPMVGVLAERAFGYQASQDMISSMPIAQRETNASALGMAILWCCIGPWVLCFIAYSFLHFTYGQDMAADKPTRALMPQGRS